MDITDITFEVGYGENRFSMKRGSFSYRRKRRYRHAAVLKSADMLENGIRMYFSEEKNNREHVLLILKKDEYVEISYENPAYEDVNRYFITFVSRKDEKFFGCGETYSQLNLKGEKVRIWVAEHQNAKRITGKLIKGKILGANDKKKLKFSEYESYYAQPTFVSSDKYFIHVDTGEYCEFDFRTDNKITIETQTPPHLFSAGAASFRELSVILSGLIGRRRGLPDWTYDGVILASQDWGLDQKGHTVSACDGIREIDRKIEICLENDIPVKGFWCQDWCGCRCTAFGYQVMWNWAYDRQKYPDLPENISRWKSKGIRFLGYINPFLALEGELYAEAKEKGYCVRNSKGEDYLVKITTFPAAMVDFSNPEAYDWYKGIIKENLIGIGMGGWMADFGEYLPTDAVLFSGQSAESMHNSWPAIWARLNREAIIECGVGDEVFFFTRAGSTQSVKYSDIMWTGDHHVDWSVDDGLPSVITASLSLAMSGFGYSHSDVGGYTTLPGLTRDRELLMRWEEMCAFSPLFRAHEGNQPGRNVQLLDDEELIKHLSRCAGWHVHLKRYLKELTGELERNGTPVMKPLFYNYDDPGCYEETTEYLLGDDLLIAPVTEPGKSSRNVYLPQRAGESWINIFDGKRYSERLITVVAKIGRPPVFVRADRNGINESLSELIEYIRGIGNE